MRLGYLSFALLVYAASAAASEAVGFPGFSYAAPEAPWSLRRSSGTSQDAWQVTGFRRAYLADGPDGASSDMILIGADLDRQPIPDHDAALAVLRQRFDAQAASGSDRIHVKNATVTTIVAGGVVCSLWHVASDVRDAPDAVPGTMILDTLSCPHPDKPAYFITVMHSVRLAPGAEPFAPKDALERLTKSIRFTPLP